MQTRRCLTPTPFEVPSMMDIAALGLTLGFFALSVVFVALCDRL